MQSSTSPAGTPQSAVVGVVVSDDFEIVFDTLDITRKAQNLRRRREIAFVLGGAAPDGERTIQYEGLADEPGGRERARLVELYYVVFPDGRERLQWPGLTYFRVQPTWLRYSDYTLSPPLILEFDRAALDALT